MRARTLVGSILAFAVLSGCAGPTRTHTPNAADRSFLQNMIAHHRRAVAVAQIGRIQADDPRVRMFAQRIVDEQAPELARMTARVTAARVPVDATAGARMATSRITDTEVRALHALHGLEFDRLFLALNIRSELGAAAMARRELGHGSDAATRTLAKAIAAAPKSEIPELQALLATLS